MFQMCLFSGVWIELVYVLNVNFGANIGLMLLGGEFCNWNEKIKL